jgi:hypothetical protein
MRTRIAAGVLFAIVLAIAPGRFLEAQGIRGTIAKKAGDATKGKVPQSDAKFDKNETGPVTSSWNNPTCGPLTPEKIGDYVRGLQAEAAVIQEFEGVLKGVRSQADAIACRNAEAMSPTYQKYMLEGFDGASPPSSQSAIEKQMAKNQAKYDAYVDTKCGKDPSKYREYDSKPKAFAAGVKASGMTEECYSWLADPTVAFCKLPKDQQQTAAEKGIRVAGTNKWLFTVGEARAIQPHCDEILTLLKKLNHRLVR